MKRDQRQIHDKGRRAFLQDTAVAGVGFAVTASLPGAISAADAQQPDAASKAKGYRLTNHILEYYKTIAG